MSTRRTKYQYDEDDFYDDQYYDDDDYYYDDYGEYGEASYSQPKAPKSNKVNKPKASTKTGSVKAKSMTAAATKTKAASSNSKAVAKAEIKKTTQTLEPDSQETCISGQSAKKKEIEIKLEVPKAKPPSAESIAKKLQQIELQEKELKPLLNLVVVGHVDAGKSTLMGHLLFKLDYVSKRVMHKFEKESKEIGKSSFAFAWIMDEHDEERARGVTVDVGVRHFETRKKRVTLLDAPGHRDFIPNMISGAAQADAALMVVPASLGEFESSFQRNGQTQEHALLVRYLGVNNIVVVINKLDTVDWKEERFSEIKHTMLSFLVHKAGFKESNVTFVPCSGLSGENLTSASEPALLQWYKGPTVLEVLETLEGSKRPIAKPFRMCVADVRSTHTVSGKIEAGYVSIKDKIIICPQIVTCTVKSIHRHGGEKVDTAKAGDNVDISLQRSDDSVLSIGSILCPDYSAVPIVSKFEANLVTLEAMEVPLFPGSKLTLFTQSSQLPATVTKLLLKQTATGNGAKSDAKTNPRFITKNQTAIVEISCSRKICLETYENYRTLSRFLLRSNGVTVAAGYVKSIIE